ncbi:MAG: ABC transporter ATP-binding protein [Candidatus Rokubacteria bacterium]|nr:ABC transporter ATP-binding protein [Candidatus Rokubacteria bacterium]
MRISLRHVTKRFGSAPAVDDLSLEIARGELVSLVGGSGCGKTTTLRMIAGFETPDAGEIAFDGRPVTTVPPRRRGVGIVFQSYALFPTMTVRENIAFGLRVARWPQTQVRARVAEMVELTHLAGFEDRYANQLSGGQQQRVALARALARRPEILLLDEPLSALDAKIRLRLRGEIRKIQQDLGITTLYVTHDQEEALSIADRIAVMSEGRVEQVGRPEEIYGAPRTGFVADFIGIANLFPCRVTNGAAGRVDWDGVALRVAPGAWRDGERVTVSVRPEKVEFACSATDANRVEGVIEVVTFLGAVVRVEVAVRGRPVWIDLPADQAATLERKKPVTLTFAPAAAVVVAGDTGPGRGSVAP